MKLIHIPVEGDLAEVHIDSFEYPNLQNATVGEGHLIERVMPATFRGLMQEAQNEGKNWIAMIVDEDGIALKLPVNQRASFLYGIKHHGTPIHGDAWIIGEGFTEEGPDFVSLDDDFDTIEVEALILMAAVIL